MKCPECQFENPEDFHFCGKCGCQLSIPSKQPGIEQSLKTKLERIQRYLPKELVKKILSQRDEIEGERRQVTIMFCDIKESTPLVEKLGPEKAFSFLNQIFEILIHKTHEYEGTVNEMRGDGIMALFGAPYAIENAPQRALQSALAIHWEIARFNEESGYHSGFPLVLLRIGINTGPVVVGRVGNDLRVQFTAVGDTINMAARMEQMAEPGTTYVTADTFRQTKGLFEFKALGKRRVKGKKKPLPIYKVLSRNKDVDRPRLGSERMIRSEMVGRDSELNRLALQVMKAINGKGSVVNIIGEAGIGKSRLIAELKKLDVADQIAFIEGRAIPIGKNLSYHPIIDFLKQWAQINTEDGEATALSKLEHAVTSVCMEDSYEVLPFVATLMGMALPGKYAERIKGIEGEALEKLILKNVRVLLIRASEITPLVIVAENLHWADTSSIELLGALYRLAETEKILFVNVFRPGYGDTVDRIIKTQKKKLSIHYIDIVLTPLNKKACKSFITSMLNLSDLHQNIIDRITRRTGGNPLFVEEVVRSLIDEGALDLKDGKFQPTKNISNVTIPDTIIDVLMTRIDRLDAETRNLLKSASVIGQEFFYRILSEVASKVEDIDDRLSYLKEIQLIRERKRMGEVEHLFNHALVQEVVYDSILPQKKIKLHLKAAASIEKVFGERLNEFYGMLAYHYSKAENLDKTEEYLIKAGEESLKTSASSEALHYYQEALELYLKNYGTDSNSEKIAILEKNIALALYNKGQHVEAVKYFDKALNYYWGKLPKHTISTIFRFLSGFSHLLVSLYLPFLKFKKIPTPIDNESIDLFFKKLKVLAIINPKRYFFESVYFYRRLTQFDLTKCELGVGMFAGASNLFSFTGISFGLSRKILDFLKGKVDKNDIKSFIIYDFSETLHKYMEGNWKTIKEYDNDLVNKNLSIGEIYWASQHIFWHGLSKLYQGDLQTTKQFINKLCDLFNVYENNLSMLLQYLLNTTLLMESCKFHDALNQIEEGIEFGQKTGQGTMLLEMYSRQAHIHVLMEEIELAEKSLKLADKVRRETETVPWQLTDFFRGQFEYDLYRLNESIRNGSKSKASQYRKMANKSWKKMLRVTKKVTQYRADSYKLKGVYYWLINKQEKAIKWWQRAIEEGERLDARLELSRVYLEIGNRLLEPGSKYKMLNGITAEEYLEKAKVLFEQMDLEWDLDELGRVCRG